MNPQEADFDGCEPIDCIDIMRYSFEGFFEPWIFLLGEGLFAIVVAQSSTIALPDERRIYGSQFSPVKNDTQRCAGVFKGGSAERTRPIYWAHTGGMAEGNREHNGCGKNMFRSKWDFERPRQTGTLQEIAVRSICFQQACSNRK